MGALLALVSSCAAFAAQFGNFTYTDTGASITITGYTGTSTGPVTIPSTIIGKPVTQIGNDAFMNKTGVTAITFPANMTSIGARAFHGCRALLNVSLPAGIQSVSQELFYGCTSLKSVTLPAGVTSIGESAFTHCKAMSFLNIPAEVTHIGNSAFHGCEALQTLSLPTGFATLGTSALFGSGFKSISVAANNPYFSSSNGVLYNKNQSILVRYPPQKADTSHVVPAGVTSVAAGAFQGSRYLRNLTLPSGLTQIGSYAFSSSISLTSINIPQGITEIRDNTFSGCSSLPFIIIPGAVKSIGYFAFKDCVKLSGITLSDGLELIDFHAFLNCGITSIHLPASVTFLDVKPFEDCSKLTSITVDANNPEFSSAGGVLFDKDQTTLLRYPSARTGPYRIHHGVIFIESIAFEGAVGLTDIIIPSTVTGIGAYAFSDCDELTGVTIPASVNSMGSSAFGSCDSLKQAVFLGNAPLVSLSPFDSAATGFTVGYYNNRTGFSSPTWKSYPTVNLGDWIDTPQDLKVEQNPGGELVSGGTVTALAETPLGSSSVVTLKLTNTGSTELTNIAITKSGGDSGDFEVSALPTDYLVGGESIAFQITFTPRALGTRAAAIQIASSDADESPFDLILAGTGTAPEISIEQPAGNAVEDGGSRDFGSAAVAETKRLMFTIKNTGTSSLSGLTTSFAGSHAADFVVSSAPAVTVAKDGSTVFVVGFRPTASGTRVAVLRITSNDPDESPYDINLTGRGVGVPEIAIEQPAGSGLKDGITRKGFGTAVVGKTGRVLSFWLRNNGTANLTGLKITRSGKHRKDFIVSKLSKAQLAPGEGIKFRVEFRPSAAGTRAARVHIESNDSDENPFDIMLSGAGAAK